LDKWTTLFITADSTIAFGAFRVHRDILAAYATPFSLIGVAIVGGVVLGILAATSIFAIRAFRIHLDILAGSATLFPLFPYAAPVDRVVFDVLAIFRMIDAWTYLGVCAGAMIPIPFVTEPPFFLFCPLLAFVAVGINRACQSH